MQPVARTLFGKVCPVWTSRTPVRTGYRRMGHRMTATLYLGQHARHTWGCGCGRSQQAWPRHAWGCAPASDRQGEPAADASGDLGGAGGGPRPWGVRWPRCDDAHGLDAAGSAGGGDTSPSRCVRSPGVRGGEPPWVRSRAACLTPGCGNAPPIAPRPLLCYPYIHPGPAALMTTRAPSGGRRTPHTGLHSKRPWGQGRGCFVRETSPSGPPDTRAGPGQDGRVRSPPALGGPVATA